MKRAAKVQPHMLLSSSECRPLPEIPSAKPLVRLGASASDVSCYMPLSGKKDMALLPDTSVRSKTQLISRGTEVFPPSTSNVFKSNRSNMNLSGNARPQSEPDVYEKLLLNLHVSDEKLPQSSDLDEEKLSIYDDDDYITIKDSDNDHKNSIDEYPDLVHFCMVNAKRDIAASFPNLKRDIRKKEPWNEPLCLIDNSDCGKFTVVQSTLQKLKEISGPVVVVSIVGPYRSGKSFLLNKIFKKTRGFEVDSRVQALTKGIWVWSLEPLVDEGPQILLIDTEGLGDASKVGGSENDQNIFVLTCLISTCMIYNSKGVIDQAAIDKLMFVSELSSKLSIFSETENANSKDALLGMYSPQLIWVIRDFTLTLKDQTPDEYLEEILTLKEGFHKAANDYNAIRKCIRIYFPNRKCFVFPHPVNDVDDYAMLNGMDDESINQGFRKSVEQLTEVLSKTKPKTFNGVLSDGKLFAHMVEQFAEDLAAGSIPNIEAALSRIVYKDNDDLLKVCIQNYKKGMNRLELPTKDGETLIRHHNSCYDAVLELVDNYYRSVDIDSDEKFQQQLKEALEVNFSEISSRNENISRLNCRQVLDICMRDILIKIESKAYMEPRGYNKYQGDFERAVQKYKLESGNSLMEKTILLEFTKEISPRAKEILEVDTALKKQESEYQERVQIEQIFAMYLDDEKRREIDLQRKYEFENQRKYETMKSNIQAKFDEKEDRMVLDAETLIQFLYNEKQKLNVAGCKDNAEYLGRILADLNDAVETAKTEKNKTKGRKFGLLKLLNSKK